MDADLAPLQRAIDGAEYEGEDKVMDLNVAVNRFVHPGMSIHVETPAKAAVRSIIREFWGKHPEFTLIMLRVGGGLSSDLVHCGMVRKLIFASGVDPFPTAHPIPSLQRAYRSGSIEMEYWSFLTLIQRFMAAACNLSFVPTNSVAGSSMEKENAHAFTTVEDPFNPGRRQGVVKPLAPDISFVHGSAADRYGNTIVLPIYEENLWGAKASKGGVIVTVEKIVPTDVIRRHSLVAKLPGYMVRAVCPAPLGSHPGRLHNLGFSGFDSYAEDEEFLANYGVAAREPEKLDAWLKEWVLECQTHEIYVKKLGEARVDALRDKAHEEDAWRENRIDLGAVDVLNPATNAEMMIITAARYIADKARSQDHKTVLAGVGPPALASAMAHYMLKREGRLLEVLAGTGSLGMSPRPGRAQLPIGSAKVINDTTEAYGVYVGGSQARALALVGAGQIDRFGNINTTKASAQTYLTGSGGNNDAVSTAKEVIAVGRQSARRLVESVFYVTSPGAKVSTLVGDLGVMEKTEEAPGELILTGYYRQMNMSPEETIANIRKNCAWDLKVSRRLKEIQPCEPAELALVRALDPGRAHSGD